MTDRQCDSFAATAARREPPARVMLARRALQLARVLLLEEAQIQGNRAIYGAVMRATWALDTQALLLTPKTATARFFRAGDDVTPPTQKEPRYEPFRGLIEQMQAGGATA